MGRDKQTITPADVADATALLGAVQSKRAQALKELLALLAVPGALRDITSEHACGAGTHEGAPGFDKEVCDAFEHKLNDPLHFVIHDVVRIEGPDEKGRVKSFTADDVDWRYGYPEDVLGALRQTA